MAQNDNHDLPMATRDAAHLPGHWLLARLGKRVLRPGGRELTERMLTDAGIAEADVLELAPGLGKTARSIISRNPASYTGVESNENAAELSLRAVEGRGRIIRGEAAHTGLQDASVDVVIGEAMLTMQTDAHKAEIAKEAFRVLRPGGRYAIHELALTPDGVDDSVKTEIRTALARSIKVNTRPLTATEWTDLLGAAGFSVQTATFAPMALLEPRRVIADEGVARTLRFLANVLRDGDARARVRGMRSTFRRHSENLAAISVIAVKGR